MDDIPALDSWDLIVAVLHGNTYQSNQERGDPCTNLVRVNPHKLSTRKKSHGMIDDLDNVDFIPSNVQSSRQEALLNVFEDNEAVIKMIIKGRSPTMRHVSRTHRVALDWLFDRINLDSKIQIKYIDTKNQLADILTKGNFTRDEWNHLLCLFNISHVSSTNCLEVMSKRTKEDTSEERVTAKSEPMMNWVSRYSAMDPNVLATAASESLVKNQICVGRRQTLDTRPRRDGACTGSKILTFTRLSAVAPCQSCRPANITLQILASTTSEGTLADGEKAFMQGDPSVRDEPLYATPPPEGLPGVLEGALIRLDREVYGLVSGMSGWRSRIVSQLKEEGYEMNVCEPCLFSKFAVREEPAVNGGSIAPGEFVGCVLLELDDHLMGCPGKAHHESKERLRQRNQVWEVAPVVTGRAVFLRRTTLHKG